MPIELAVAESQFGIYLQLRYRTFVLFDTGDLETLADELVDLLMAAGGPAP